MNDGKENLKQKNAGNPIFIIIIFAVLIGFIFFIPEVYKRYNKELYNFFKGGENGEQEKDKNQDKDEKSPKSAFYQLGERSTLKFNEIELSDISLDDGVLTFTVDTSDTLDLDTLDYYIEFYKARKTFLGRRALHGKFSKKLDVSLDVSNLNLETTDFMTVSLITTDGIPTFDVTSDESGLSMIECKKDDEVYQYDFYLKKLIKATYKYSYEDSDMDSLASKLLEFQKKEKTYNEYTGITAHITETDNSFIFMSEFDYESVSSFKKIEDYRIYDKSTLNNVVKFKMEAEGFECR